MYCNECGRANPDEARFCAYCGAKLLAAEAKAREEPAPAKEAPRQERAPKADSAPRRPRRAASGEPQPPFRTLRPVVDNPAQPLRQPGPRAADPDDLFLEAEKPAKGAPSAPGKSPAERRAEKNLVLTSDGAEEMPARKPPVRRDKRETFIPERIAPKKEAPPEPMGDDMADEDDAFFVKPKKARKPDREDGAISARYQKPREEDDDAFFERPAKPRPRRDEDEIDDDYVNGRVRRILAGIAFAVCLALAFWLFATRSGQVFLAGFGVSGSAEAYRQLGDDAYAGNQIKRAAEAYYQALALDATDYDTALKVGVTQQQIGNYEKAESAYYMCTQLRPAEPEPYRLLVKLYTSRGDTQKAEYFRSLGLQNTGTDPAQ